MSPVSTKSYWLDLFTHQTWQDFIAAGGNITGFRESRWKTVQAIRPGDILLCYLTGVSRWIGLLEVTGKGFQSNESIWRDNIFPARIPVKVIAKLDPLTAVPVLLLRDQLSFFQNLKSPHAWTGWFRASPSKWNQEDGKVVESSIVGAVSHPVERPFDPAKLKKIPPILKMASGKFVTVPQDDPRELTEEQSEILSHPAKDTVSVTVKTDQAAVETKEQSAHLEIQWILAKLGSDMGLDIWVAKNDRSKTFNGQAFTGLPRLKQTLPVNFDDATRKTVELIDILWLKGNSIVAAFEIERRHKCSLGYCAWQT
jgi:hypothetical protein